MFEAAKREGAFLLVVFPGGRGTTNCIAQARELGYLVLRAEVP
jgi:hypothetical protein